MRYSIGVDFGGTKIVAGLVEEHGNIVKKIRLPTHAEKGKGFVLKQLVKIISWMVEGFNKKYILGIGIGIASPVDFEKQVATNPPNLPFKNIELAKIIQKKFKIKTVMDNDANCAAIAENMLTEAKDFVLLTLGTGIGGAIVINNKIYRGKDGYAGELGHTVIDSKGPKCDCGSRGCLETLASGKVIETKSKAVFGKALLAYELAKMSDRRAKKILKDVGTNLGIGLANIVNALNPDEIVLAGGVTDCGSAVIKPAVKEMRKRVFTKARNAPVRVSRLEDSGLLGAAYLVLNKEAAANYHKE